MAKSRERNPHQLQLRVFSQVDGGLLRTSADDRIRPQKIDQCEQAELRSASAEDREIYNAIVERYFNSDR